MIYLAALIVILLLLSLRHRAKWTRRAAEQNVRVMRDLYDATAPADYRLAKYHDRQRAALRHQHALAIWLVVVFIVVLVVL